MTTTEEIHEKQIEPAWKRFESAEDNEARWALILEHMTGDIQTYPAQSGQKSPYRDSLSTYIIEKTAFNFRIPKNMVDFIVAQKHPLDKAELTNQFGDAKSQVLNFAWHLRKDSEIFPILRSILGAIERKEECNLSQEP